MEFCPTCANILLYELPNLSCPARFSCPTCPYVAQIETGVKLKRHVRLVKKQMDPIFSKKDLEDFKVAERVSCRECINNEVVFTELQMNAADEPMTRIYQCKRCGHTWKEN